MVKLGKLGKLGMKMHMDTYCGVAAARAFCKVDLSHTILYKWRLHSHYTQTSFD